MENSYSGNKIGTTTVSAISFDRIAKIAFFLYLFFVFYGTSLPFQGNELDVTSYESNPVRQLIFGIIYLLAFISILPAYKKVFNVIKKEKFLTLFLFWALLSLSWSGYPEISLKRWLQIFGSYLVCFSFLLRVETGEEILHYFRIITYTYIILTFIAVFTIPAASVNYQGEIAWKGIEPHKNTLGQVVLISGMISIISINYYKSGYKILDYIITFLAVILLLGSKSTTSILTGFGISGIAFLAYFLNRFDLGGILKWFTYSSIFILSLLVISIIIIFPSLFYDFFQFLGKDPTFTGRTDLWILLLGIAGSGNIFLGAGFGGFWVYGSQNLQQLYSLVMDTPIQAHNGYVDLFIETGIIGIAIVFIMIAWYFYNLHKFDKGNYWKYFLIAALILNLQEATLFKLNDTSSVLFIFSYLALFTKLFFNNSSLASD